MTPIILDFVAHNARTMPDRIAAVELATGRRWTFAEFDADARRIEAVLRDRVAGIDGQRIQMISRNSATMLLVQQACVRAGAIFVPLNWRLAAPEIAEVIAECEPALLIHEAAFDGLIPAGLAAPVLRIADDRDELAEAMAGHEPDGVGDGRRLDPDKPITVLYSSGTTGQPKGAVVSLFNGFTGGLGLALGTHIGPDSRFLIEMPLFHTAGLFGAAWATMIAGGQLVIGRAFDPQATYDRIADRAQGITHFFSVTHMAMQMRLLPGFDGRRLAGLTAYITGGEPNPEAHQRAWLDEGVMMVNGWGMSETCSSTAQPLGDFDMLRRKAGSIGVPHLTVELKAVRADGTEAAVGEVGELWARGAPVVSRYWNRPELDAQAFVDGWFRTGDAAVRDADGYWTIVDRMKDMFISGGENIYSVEIEAVIAEMPEVAEVAVIGIPDERWGEVGCAFIIPRAGVTLDEAAVLAHCGQRLARFKLPKRIVLTDEMDRTASGKVQKHHLRARYKAGL
ncbi:MAG TPA: AMP-binding protein [Sphingomonadaceae bacterium]|nr:AMP-binding protein [Sphingomonadaceae bacterium]